MVSSASFRVEAPIVSNVVYTPQPAVNGNVEEVFETHFEPLAKKLDGLSPFNERTYIVVKTQFEGLHRYPNAPDEVAFLRNEHRHMFHIEAKLEVFHNDREVEFIICKRFINALLTNSQQDYKSCEMIAESIANAIVQRFGKRDVSVTVSEDNENGGVYERTYKS